MRVELDAAALSMVLREDGYHDVGGLPSRLVVAELRVIAETEGDDVLRWFALDDALTVAARRWIRQHVHTGSDEMSMDVDEDLEGFNQYAKELMKKLPLEERLEDLAPEQRLAGLAPEEALLALPEVTLRGLPQSYIDGLPERVRDAIRARLTR